MSQIENVAGGTPGEDWQLAAARDAFVEAQRTLEIAREHLMRAHADTTRAWATR